MAVPLGVVVGIFGISFGVLAAGTPAFGPAAALFMSAATFAGSAQFATLTVIAVDTCLRRYMVEGLTAGSGKG